MISTSLHTLVIKITDFLTHKVLIRSFVLGFARLGEDDFWWERDGKTIINAEDEAKNSSLYVDCREGSRYVMLEKSTISQNSENKPLQI